MGRELGDRGEHVARHRAHRSVRRQRDPPRLAAAVFGDRLMGVQVERHDQRARAVGRRQRQSLPAARAQLQRRVLELRLGRGQLRRQLAEQLGVRVQGVAGLAPLLIGDGWP